MAQTIKLRRSATQGGTPTVSQLSLGEVAINTYDGKLYIKKDDGTESIVEIGGASSGGLPLSGGTMTGKLVLPDAGYSLGNEYHKWKRAYTVTTSSPQEILYSDGNSLPTGGVYRFTAHISGTGTDQFATAVYWNQNGTWRINVTGQSGTSSNHPEFIIDATTTKPTIHIDHSSSYEIHILGERIELDEGIGTDNAGYAFGTDAFLGSVNNNLYFLPGGTAATGPNSYDDGNAVWHTGNLTTTNKSNYDTAYGWGNHASAGYLTSYTDTNTTYAAGTGVTLTGTTFSLTDTNAKLNLSGGTISGAPSDTNGVLTVSNTYSGGGVYYPAARFINTYANHTFGVVAEFRTNSAAGTDRPTILFTTDLSSHTWQVGSGTSGTAVDDFVIGYRGTSNDPDTFSLWSTPFLTLNHTTGNATFAGTISSGVITATGGTSTNWNTAYAYSQIGHLPVAGGTITGNLLIDSASAEINLKSGTGTESGAINWTFNTTNTDYASIKLPYATRATKGLWVDSGYPITVDATSRIDFDISGSTKMVMDAGGLSVTGKLAVGDAATLTSTSETFSTASASVIASFSASTYGAAKVIITVKDGSNRHICEMLVTHNGTTAIATQYGSIYTSSELATFEVDISGGNVRILATASSSNSTVYRVAQTLMEA